MPPKKDQNKVRSFINKYGYDFLNMQKYPYKNNYDKMKVVNLQTGAWENISLKTFMNRVKRGDYKEFHRENDINNIALSTNPPIQKSSFERWLEHQDKFVEYASPEEQREIYNNMQTNIKKMMQKKDYNITQDFDFNSMKSLIEAFKVVGPRLTNQNVRLTFHDKDGHVYYRILNENTITYLDDLIYKDNFEIRDSFDDFVHSVNEITKIDIEFRGRKEGKRINAGFFPFINNSDIDLKRYGIFNNINEDGINESCLLTAFKSSNILTDSEFNMLKSFIRTRTVPQVVLRDISNLLMIHINCKIIYENGNISHIDFGIEFKEDKSIKLIILNSHALHGSCACKSHYILNERTNISECYIKKYQEINEDIRFKNHPRKMMLLKFDPKRYTFSKRGMKIVKLIQLMIENNLLVPMTQKQINQLNWSFKPQSFDLFEGVSRSIKIGDKTVNNYKLNNKKLQTKFFFGYDPDPNEVNYRLNELQKVVDSLPLKNHIDVSLYYKFSEIMQKIMYEYGCFDGVLELSGNKAKLIRDQCIFPRSHTYNEKPLYLKKKLYYIDLNGAFLAAIDGIPMGEDFKEKNTKIKQLIETLYNIRMEAKKNGNNKLATTLKFMINSCWGYSIRRPKIIKHKYTNNVENYIETFAPYVIGYNYVDNNKGFVDTINSFVPHFTVPQFAKEVLDNFNKKMDEISKLVNVYYYNIDAILIDENDYNKLVKLGYINDNLGGFKIEHIFTEIAIKSSKKYVAKLEDGTKFYHCVKGVDYDEFVNSIKN